MSIITTELELELIRVYTRRLGKIERDKGIIIPMRKEFKTLIKDYETKHWRDVREVTDEQVKENDEAVKIAEQYFINNMI